MHNFKPFFVTLPTLRGSKNLVKELFLACLHSVSSRKQQAKPIKKCLFLWFYEFSSTSSSPIGYTKNFNSLLKQRVIKKWCKYQIFPSSIFLLFFSQSWTLWYLFLFNSFCFNIKHFFFYHSMDNNLRDISLHFHVIRLILSREIQIFLERINSRTPPNLFLTHT